METPKTEISPEEMEIDQILNGTFEKIDAINEAIDNLPTNKPGGPRFDGPIPPGGSRIFPQQTPQERRAELKAWRTEVQNDGVNKLKDAIEKLPPEKRKAEETKTKGKIKQKAKVSSEKRFNAFRKKPKTPERSQDFLERLIQRHRQQQMEKKATTPNPSGKEEQGRSNTDTTQKQTQPKKQNQSKTNEDVSSKKGFTHQTVINAFNSKNSREHNNKEADKNKESENRRQQKGKDFADNRNDIVEEKTNESKNLSNAKEDTYMPEQENIKEEAKDEKEQSWESCFEEATMDEPDQVHDKGQPEPTMDIDPERD